MTNKKSVLFFVPSLGMGGMERVLVNYANLFHRRGYDVTVKNFSHDDETIVSGFDKEIHYENQYVPVKNVFHAGIKNILSGNFRFLPHQLWTRFHSAKYLYKRYVKENYDVEIAFYGTESIKIISGSTNKEATKIGWIHSVNIEEDIPLFGGYKKAKLIYSNIQKIICVSERSKEIISKLFNRSEGIYVVNNPNDSKTIRALSLVGEPLKKENFTFITVSRINNKEKGFFRILDVCKRLKEAGYQFRYWIVGSGMDYEVVKAKANELHLDNVTFFGKQSNPYRYIKAADMYLCTSYMEAFSMVMMEAIILSTPILTTDVSGASEMLDDGKYGMIVENSEEGLFEGMKKILSDKKLYEHYQAMASLRKDYLSEETIMDKVEGIINDGK